VCEWSVTKWHTLDMRNVQHITRENKMILLTYTVIFLFFAIVVMSCSLKIKNMQKIRNKQENVMAICLSYSKHVTI